MGVHGMSTHSLRNIVALLHSEYFLAERWVFAHIYTHTHTPVVEKPLCINLTEINEWNGRIIYGLLTQNIKLLSFFPAANNCHCNDSYSVWKTFSILIGEFMRTWDEEIAHWRKSVFVSSTLPDITISWWKLVSFVFMVEKQTKFSFIRS